MDRDTQIRKLLELPCVRRLGDTIYICFEARVAFDTKSFYLAENPVALFMAKHEQMKRMIDSAFKIKTAVLKEIYDETYRYDIWLGGFRNVGVTKGGNNGKM